jgi:hypothetical protein
MSDADVIEIIKHNLHRISYIQYYDSKEFN